jgi:hypothetical protein
MNGGEHRADRSKWPLWVQAVNTLTDGLDQQNMPTYHSARSLSRLAQALASCPDTPKPLRRANYRPSELVRKAREYIAAADAENFANYREKCRAELEQIGEVFSGMCSCWQFIVPDYPAVFDRGSQKK